MNTHWIHCIENFFHRSAFLNNLHLPWKTEFSLKFFTVPTTYFLSFRIFEQLALALKNRFDLKFFTVLKNFYHSGFLSHLCLPWKFSLRWIYFYIQDFLATCAFLEQQSVSWIHLLNAYFYHSGIVSNLRLSWKQLKTVCPENFQWIEIFFIIQEFWATCACPENRICPEIFQAGGWQPPLVTRLVRLWACGVEDENTTFYNAWKMTISKRHE